MEDASTQHLTVKVYDDEGVQASELIGCAVFQICQLEPGKVKDVWLKLVKDLDFQRDNKNRGQVRTLARNKNLYKKCQSCKYFYRLAALHCAIQVLLKVLVSLQKGISCLTERY